MSTQELAEAASTIFDEMLRDLILPITISAHREIKRGRTICGVCGTRCRSHDPLTNNQTLAPSSQSTAPPASRAPSPLPSSSSVASTSLDGRNGGYIAGPNKGTGGSTGIGSGSGRADAGGNVFFACLICDRQVASSRYAPHLSGCLGFNGSTRRTASRSAVAAAAASAKARLGSTAGSERGGSEAGDSDDGSVGGSLKKGKMLSTNTNGKRVTSPKKAGAIKKAKSGNGGTPSPLPRQALPPSKLGRPPTTNPSASPSPGPSIISLAESGGTSYTAVGSVGRKTIPGYPSGSGRAPSSAMVISDDDDDY